MRLKRPESHEPNKPREGYEIIELLPQEFKEPRVRLIHSEAI
jgi:hypothetical protein